MKSQCPELYDAEWLRAKYVDEQLSAEAIGKLINTTKHSVCRFLKRYGIVARKRTSKYRLINDKEWLVNAYENRRLSIKQIADLVGSSCGNIHSALVSSGITLRQVKEGLNIRFPEGRYGELSSNWNDGISKLGHRIRTCRRYLLWRKAVLARDKSICQNCTSLFNVEVDHKTQFASILRKYEIKTIQEAMDCEYLWDVDNGRTLCHNCHVQTDTHSKRNY